MAETDNLLSQEEEGEPVNQQAGGPRELQQLFTSLEEREREKLNGLDSKTTMWRLQFLLLISIGV